MANKQMDAYYGKDLPSASFKWGVVVQVVGLDRPNWLAVAWFKSRKRAVEYAETGWKNYAIARMK